MAHTNVYMNWTGITITPSGGSLINITEIKSVDVLDSDDLRMWQADGHKFATVVVAASGMRGVTLAGGDIYKLTATIPRGTPCTVVAILNDAKNGTGSGAITHTWANAVVSDVPNSGQSNEFAGGSITLVCYSPDGTTDPLTREQAT